jgi:hypothetical protein
VINCSWPGSGKRWIQHSTSSHPQHPDALRCIQSSVTWTQVTPRHSYARERRPQLRKHCKLTHRRPSKALTDRSGNEYQHATVKGGFSISFPSPPGCTHKKRHTRHPRETELEGVRSTATFPLWRTRKSEKGATYLLTGHTRLIFSERLNRVDSL